MRANYVVLLVAATLASCTNGLTVTDNSAQVVSAVANSSPVLARVDNTGRYLKGSKKAIEENESIHEERGGVPSLSRLKSMLQKIPTKIGDKYLNLEYQLSMLCFLFLSLILVAPGVFQLEESYYADQGLPPLKFHQSMHFVFATLSTGCGDISPHSTTGQFFVMFIIVVVVRVILEAGYAPHGALSPAE
ncbi:hypothetical protein KRP22_011558 [Phytophthora ramorum]|nr:hypothetical protein KRP22_10763 [Phytophthora ramorum]